jgi:hypothetical protein
MPADARTRLIKRHFTFFSGLVVFNRFIKFSRSNDPIASALLSVVQMSLFRREVGAVKPSWS